MTGHIHWLASYPKSGNTWMRILLTNYLRDGDEPADINALSGGPIASARQAFDDNVGIEASDLTQDEIERLRPGVYELMSDEYATAVAAHDGEQPPDPLFLKVHDAFTLTADGVPLISRAATAGAIYLVRDPRDVAVSFAHHSAAPVDKIVGKMADPDYAFVDKGTRLHNQLRQRLLTWSGHVSSWVDAGLRTLVVRYEDLSADTAAVFSSVLSFAGLDPDPARVAKAVEFSRFDRLHEQEAEGGFTEKMPLAESFFRKGRVGSWADSLGAELAAQIVTDHQAVMERFGYLSVIGDTTRTG